MDFKEMWVPLEPIKNNHYVVWKTPILVITFLKWLNIFICIEVKLSEHILPSVTSIMLSFCDDINGEANVYNDEAARDDTNCN